LFAAAGIPVAANFLGTTGNGTDFSI